MCMLKIIPFPQITVIVSMYETVHLPTMCRASQQMDKELRATQQALGHQAL